MLNAKVLFLIFLAILGGFQFGYQTSIIAGALPFVGFDFDLSGASEGFLVSIILIGAILGASGAGWLADRFGRRPTTLTAALLYLFGALLSAFSGGLSILLAGRMITGIAVGLTSLVAPLYLAEIAPNERRGTIVSCNQLAITIGIMVAYGISLYFAPSSNWRWMVGVGIIPALIQIIGFPFFHESPRWLISKGYVAKASHLLKDCGENLRAVEFSEMKQVGSYKKGTGWRLLFRPPFLNLLGCGIVLSVFQQMTGINTVIYYAPKIFQCAGYSSVTGALFATFGIGIMNVLCTLLSVWLIDRLGRRWLLIFGTVGMAVCLFFLCLSFFMSLKALDLVALLSLTGYVCFFAIGLGPITWVLLSEIYPLRMRARAMSISSFANWASNYFVVLTFPALMRLLGSAGVFCLYGLICVLAIWFLIRYIPETKGKSLEELEIQTRDMH